MLRGAEIIWREGFLDARVNEPRRVGRVLDLGLSDHVQSARPTWLDIIPRFPIFRRDSFDYHYHGDDEGT